MNYGVATPKWVILKSFTNSSKSCAMTWSEKITKTVGYQKSHFKSLENTWNVSGEVSMGVKFEAGFLIKTTIATQFKLSTSHGGISKETEEEDWSEAYTTEEEISVTIGPGQSIYIWQFRLGFFGSHDILFCRDLQLTNTPTAPTSMPPF